MSSRGIFKLEPEVSKLKICEVAFLPDKPHASRHLRCIWEVRPWIVYILENLSNIKLSNGDKVFMFTSNKQGIFSICVYLTIPVTLGNNINNDNI